MQNAGTSDVQISPRSRRVLSIAGALLQGMMGWELHGYLVTVVWNMTLIFHNIIYGIILPIDFHIFQDG
jgi:hypothetical protein